MNQRHRIRIAEATPRLPKQRDLMGAWLLRSESGSFPLSDTNLPDPSPEPIHRIALGMIGLFAGLTQGVNERAHPGN